MFTYIAHLLGADENSLFVKTLEDMAKGITEAVGNGTELREAVDETITDTAWENYESWANSANQ